MTKESALEYLKYLHQLEQDLKKDLFGADKYELVERIRVEFIKNYQDKKRV